MVRGRLANVHAAFPAAVSQRSMWDDCFAARYGDVPKAAAMWDAAGVTSRHAAIDPRVEDASGWSTGRRMRRYVEEATPLAVRAAAGALAAGGLCARELGLLVVVSCTGYATPGLDLLVACELGAPASVQRVAIGHMGCYAAVPALATAADAVAARGLRSLVLCVELTSLHVQPADRCVDQLVSHSLFGDAAVAAVVHDGDGLEVVDVLACTNTEHRDAMTWHVTDLGFRMGLSSRVPAVLARHVRGVVDELLHRNNLRHGDVAGWAVHPGGPRILDVCAERLGLDEEQMDASRSTLAERGNCSSATILLVIDRLVRSGVLARGDHAVALAFGPGLTLYAALLRRVPAPRLT